MQKTSPKAHLAVLQIVDKLLTVLSNSELKKYRKATIAAREATEICSRLHHQMYRHSPDGVKWFRSREYREYLREVRK